jgi:hypothetical protein
MNIKYMKKLMTGIIACTLAWAVSAGALQSGQSQDAPPTMQGQTQMQSQPPMQGPAPMQGQMLAARLSPQQMQELVGPIALYPDALVAQILAASAYPTQIVEANRFLQQNPNLTGAALGSEREGFDAISFRTC